MRRLSLVVVVAAAGIGNGGAQAATGMWHENSATDGTQVYTIEGRFLYGDPTEEGTLPPWSMNDPWLYRGYDDDPRADFKLQPQPRWLREQRMTPRKPRRVPSNTPGPGYSYRRGAY